FVDTPVKRYSSGMQARLGFAVAVHVDPDVLLLDEVLAVGDLQFQERCLERIRALHADGRTILLVSHDLTAVAQFCTSVLWLDAAGRPTARFTTGAPLIVRLRYRARRRVRRPVFGVAIYAGGLQIGGPNTRVDGRPIDLIEGEGELRYRIAALSLLAGAYTLSA